MKSALRENIPTVLPSGFESKGEGHYMKKFIGFLREEDGLESVEYALLAVLIAL